MVSTSNRQEQKDMLEKDNVAALVMTVALTHDLSVRTEVLRVAQISSTSDF